MAHMIERKSGKIINIASIAGKTSPPILAHYAASKAGAISFTQALASELAPHRINVNAVCPGLIWTPLWERMAGMLADRAGLPPGTDPRGVFDAAVQQTIPMKTEQTAEDIAMTVVFLASNESDQITGQSINVDGGAELH